MNRPAECGTLPPAAGRTPYCPACHAMEQVGHDDNDDDKWRRDMDRIFDRLERITVIHRQYRAKRR